VSEPLIADPPSASPALRIWLGLLCFLGGLTFELAYGTRGFMPLDHSIVFDGGWRILSGQIPFREFGMPSAATPSFIQSLFFWIGGVNWASYIAHAAVFNGIFCMLVYGFLARLGLPLKCATLYGIASGALLFAPVGVPFPEQHAFFFSTLGLWLFLVGRTSKSSKRARIALALVPTALALGFFSKQFPSGLAPLLVLALLAAPSHRPKREAVLGLGVGVLCMSLLAGLYLVGFGVEAGSVRYALYELPMEVADLRMSFLPAASRMPGHILQVGLGQGLWSVLTLHILFLGGGAYLLAKRPLGWGWAAGLLALAELTLLIDVITIVLANNQDGVGAGWFFLALGVGHSGLVLLVHKASLDVRVGKGIGLLLICVLVRDVASFSNQVNRTRIANDMQFNAELAAQASEILPPSLSALDWTVPDHHRYEASDFVAVLDYLKGAPGDFFLIGDSSILYGLSGKRSILPTAWYHPGVTLPKKGSPDFRAWQQQILANMESGEGREEVLRIVEEKAGTWIGNWRLGDLPLVKKAVSHRILEQVDLGAFLVTELRPSLAE
jgi:hypothetical protein